MDRNFSQWDILKVVPCAKRDTSTNSQLLPLINIFVKEMIIVNK
jgi:hypothetical protein